jgi:hypothetical protein
MAAPQTLAPASKDFVLFDDDPIYQDFRPPNYAAPPHSFTDHFAASRADVDSYVAMLGDQSVADEKPFYQLAADMPAGESALSYEEPAYTYGGSDMPLSMAPYDQSTPAPAPVMLIHPPTFPTPAHLSQLYDYRTPISPATSAGGLEGHSSAGSEAGSIGSPLPGSLEFNPTYVGMLPPSLARRGIH